MAVHPKKKNCLDCKTDRYKIIILISVITKDYLNYYKILESICKAKELVEYFNDRFQNSG